MQRIKYNENITIQPNNLIKNQQPKANNPTLTIKQEDHQLLIETET